jgi:hypothetical protein
VKFGGNWIGASRNCPGTLAKATQPQIKNACEQLSQSRNLCEQIVPFCPVCDLDRLPEFPRELDSDDPTVRGLLEGFRAQGIALPRTHIRVWTDAQGKGYVRFMVRLDHDQCALPMGECVMQAVEAGRAA